MGQLDRTTAASRKAPRLSKAEQARREQAQREARFPGGPEQVKAEVRAVERARRKAERERVLALSQRDHQPRRASDLGSELMIEREQVEVRESLIPNDPDERNGPAVRGKRGQRVWAPDRLLRLRTIGPAEHQAAERYLDDFEIGHEGARDRRLVLIAREPSGVRLPGPSDRQINALRRYREATARVGKAASGILHWCVLRVTPADQPATIEAFARANRPWTADRATGVLLGALSALAAYYGTGGASGEGDGGKRRHTIAGHAGHGPDPAPLPHRQRDRSGASAGIAAL